MFGWYNTCERLTLEEKRFIKKQREDLFELIMDKDELVLQESVNVEPNA